MNLRYPRGETTVDAPARSRVLAGPLGRDSAAPQPNRRLECSAVTAV